MDNSANNRKSTFLNGLLEEELYIEQPLSYMQREEEKKALRLKKALYDKSPEHKMKELILISKRVGMNNVHMNKLSI